LKYIIKELKTVSIVVDESFIDFFDKSHSVETEVYTNKNLIVIRSLSKDFGTGLTDAQLTNFNTRVQDFNLELNRQQA
jgi:hypothetical protein